jgi:hypothetical protein
MKTHFRVMLTWLTKYRGPGLVSGIVVFGLFVALASDARSSSWKDKDWSQWTPEDIQEILWYSPWASFIKQDSPPADRTRVPVPTPRAIIVSSLVIRQVFARVGQSTFFTFPSMPGQQIIEPGDVDCINENFADRIIVRFFNEEGAFKTPPDLIVSGRKIQPLQDHRANSTNCAIGGGNDVSYPRMVVVRRFSSPVETILSSKQTWTTVRQESVAPTIGLSHRSTRDSRLIRKRWFTRASGIFRDQL